MYYVKPIKTEICNQWKGHRTIRYALSWYANNLSELEGTQWMISKDKVPESWDACPIYAVENGKLKKTNDLAFIGSNHSFLRII